MYNIIVISAQAYVVISLRKCEHKLYISEMDHLLRIHFHIRMKRNNLNTIFFKSASATKSCNFERVVWMHLQTKFESNPAKLNCFCLADESQWNLSLISNTCRPWKLDKLFSDTIKQITLGPTLWASMDTGKNGRPWTSDDKFDEDGVFICGCENASQNERKDVYPSNIEISPHEIKASLLNTNIICIQIHWSFSKPESLKRK